MKIIADMHCHTIASSHAYSTIQENAKSAKENGLKLIAITDHGCALPDAPHPYYFFNLRVIPKIIDGVYILKGIEANVLDYDGNIDLPAGLENDLDWVIASMHSPCFEPGTQDDHTRAWIAVANNKYVDVIGHSGTEKHRYDYERVIQEFKIKGKIVEINSSSFSVREGSKKNCRCIADLCKKYEVPVVVNSDSHFAPNIGKVDAALKMLAEIDFPEKLILNSDLDKLVKSIKDIRGKDILA